MAAGNPKSPELEDVHKIDHESDIEYALQQTRWILTIMGMWPRSNPTRCQRFLSILAMPSCAIGAIVILFPIISYAIVEDGQILMLFGVLNYQTQIILKSFVLICRLKTVKVLLEHIKTNWRTLQTSSDREILMRNVKVGRDITTFCFVCLYGSSCYYLIMPWFAPPYTNEFNQTVRRQIFVGWDNFVDLQAGYNHEIVYLISLLCGLCGAFINLVIYNVALTFVTHACGQFQIVVSRLETLVSLTEDIVDIEPQIQFIIRTHMRVLGFSSNIKDLLREICLVEVVSNTLLICWIEYWFWMELERRMIMGVMQFFLLFISYSSNLFIFCHIGELLQEECQKVGKAAYMIEWYKLPGKTGLGLVLIMIISKYPCKLTAGRIIELTYYSFGSIIKTTVAYSNMMRALTA